jgi:glucokinase-like ROK family protein
MKKATRQQTKVHNRNLVLHTIINNESVSRAEIARITSLTKTTVSDIVADLLEEGLIAEIGVGESLGGKNPILLSLLPDSRCLLGLDLAHNQFQGAIVNLRGQIQKKASLPVNDRDGNEALALVYEILDQLIPGCNLPLVGIGVGTPGLVNTRDGVVVDAVNLDWHDFPLAQLLKDRYHLPVYILNDSQAAAIGEYTYGKGHIAESSLVVIHVHHGIGSGIVINGHLFQGDGGGAGEIGHVVVVSEGGLLCRCGNRGCLETVASAQAIVRRIRTLANESYSNSWQDPAHKITLDEVERAYNLGDPLALQVVSESARYMGLAISGLVGILNIHEIVLSGDMTSFGRPWLDTIVDTMQHTSLSRSVQDTRVEFGQLGANAVILGSTAVMANNYSLLFTGQPTQAEFTYQ